MSYTKVLSFINTLRNGRFFILIILNTLMCFAVFSSVVADNPLKTHGVAVVDRKVASVISVHNSSKSLEQYDYKMITLDLECIKGGALKKIKSTAKYIRIKGKVCGGGKVELVDFKLFNRSSGYEATVFNLPKNHFTTDYMSLNPGSNKLMLQSELKNGENIIAELNIDYFENPKGQAR